MQEQIEQATLGVLTWVEPMKQWIETAVSICKIAKSDDQLAKKSLCQQIFGSNLKMRQKEVVVNDDQFLISPLKSHWQALRAAREKTAQRAANSDPSSVLVRVERIELSSQVWKTCILAAVLHPRTSSIIAD